MLGGAITVGIIYFAQNPAELVHSVTPTAANPGGFKGAGESGTIPAPAAISNAVEDALRKRKPDAVVDRLPITSDRIVELLSQ